MCLLIGNNRGKRHSGRFGGLDVRGRGGTGSIDPALQLQSADHGAETQPWRLKGF